MSFSFLGKRKIHYTFPDSRELAEEYDFKSGNLVGRENLSY